MFDEIFTYSQSISSPRKNSLVSARKGKRGSGAHIELSYFVSFFSLSRSFFQSDNILCSFLLPKVSCPLCGRFIPAHVSSQRNITETQGVGVSGEKKKIPVVSVLWTSSLL